MALFQPEALRGGVMEEQPIKRSPEEWDHFFLRWAAEVAELSKDPDRKVGAFLVAPGRRQFSMGYNGFPADLEDLPSLLADRDFKRLNMVHAEANCLKQAPFSPVGSTIYVTRFPCLECAKQIAWAGVHRVVAPAPDFAHPRWGHSWGEAQKVLSSHKVQIKEVVL